MPWGRVVRLLVTVGATISMGAAATLVPGDDDVIATSGDGDLGRIDLQVNDSDSVAGFSAMSVPKMLPGDTTAGVLTVENDGTVPLRYSVKSRATDPDGRGLRAHLIVKVTGDDATTGTGRSVTCAGIPLPDSGHRFTRRLVGSPSAQRVLLPGASETLCVQAHLWEGAPSRQQGATTEVTFTIRGTS